MSFKRVPSNVHSADETGLNLKPGTRFFGTVRAINSVGLSTTASTDGIVVDQEVPLVGVVLDGDHLGDVQYQSSTSALSAHWHGFFDRHSFIKKYLFGIGGSPGMWDVSSLHDVGLRLRGEKLSLNLASGRRYFATVVAVDAAGLHSPPVGSDGVTVDTSPPIVVACRNFSGNLIENSTFKNKTNATFSEGESIGNWVLFRGQANLFTSGTQHGILLSGELRQNLTVVADVTYEIVVRARLSGSLQSQQLLVAISDTRRVITLRDAIKRYTFSQCMNDGATSDLDFWLVCQLQALRCAQHNQQHFSRHFVHQFSKRHGHSRKR